MGRSTVHYADNETNNILKRLHNKLRPAGTPVERVEYIIELLLLRIFETKLRQDDVFKSLRKLFEGEKNRLLFSYLQSLSNGDSILLELNKYIFPFYATILQEARKTVKDNLPSKIQDQLVLMEEVFANSNFTNNVKGGVINEVIGLINEIDEKYILKTDLLGDAIESALSETGGTKDLGLYRTPDHIRQMMVAMVDPEFTDSIFDPACGTAGFLFDAYDYVINKSNSTNIYPSESVAKMFYRTGIGGIEYQGRIRKMAAVNMYIRGLNPHNIMQGDSLKMYDPAQDAGSKTVVIANPPFGAERDQPAYPNVWEEYSKESETTILFVKLMFDYLKTGGRCAVVVSEGFLTWGQGSACALRKMLLNEANLRAIISLPQGVFVSKSGQGAKTSILYFEKGQPTDFVWYYKIENDGFSIGTNRKSIEGSQIPECLALFQTVKHGKKPKDTSRSFCIDREQIATLDPQTIERITVETREKVSERNAPKLAKKIAELDRKLTEKKISKIIYNEELLQFDSNLEAQIENEIAKAIEKAHTYHFNLQNYRAGNEEKHTEYQLVKLENFLIDISNERQFEIQDDKIYCEPTISTKTNIISTRNEALGNELKVKKRILIKKGDLVVGLLHTQNGSFAISDTEYASTGTFVPFKVNEEKINKKYLFFLLKSTFAKLGTNDAIGRENYKIMDILKLQIPLPPLEIQNEIVEKIGKQKQIIEGADKLINAEKASRKNVLDNYGGEKMKVEDIFELQRGYDLPKSEFINGDIPVVGSNGIIGFHNIAKCEHAGIVTGRSGTIGEVHWIDKPFWPHNTSLYVKNFKGNNPRFIYYLLQTLNLKQLANNTTAVPSLDRKNVYSLNVVLPSLEMQQQIVKKLDKQMVALESVRFLKAEAEKRIEEILAEIWKEKPVAEVLEFTQESVVQNESDVEEKAFLKRKMLATYIINQSLNDPNFGDVKFEKLFYLSEYFILKRNFGQNYYVQAAGPYDNKFTMGYFKQVEQSKWFIRQRNGNQYTFSKGEEHDKSLNTYCLFSDKELEKVNMLINYFKNFTYEIPEITATLYAVWNNRIIKQKPITDDFLKEDFLNWDEQKIKHKDRLDKALKWMRKNGIVPDGWGKVIEKVNKKVK